MNIYEAFCLQLVYRAWIICMENLDELEQIKRLRSRNTPAAPRLPILSIFIESIRSKSKLRSAGV